MKTNLLSPNVHMNVEFIDAHYFLNKLPFQQPIQHREYSYTDWMRRFFAVGKGKMNHRVLLKVLLVKLNEFDGAEINIRRFIRDCQKINSNDMQALTIREGNNNCCRSWFFGGNENEDKYCLTTKINMDYRC